MLTCIKCNNQNPEGSILCDNCHEPLIGAQSNSETCIHCGVVLNAGDSFCTACGNPQNQQTPPANACRTITLSLEDGTRLADIKEGESRIIGRNSGESDISLSHLPEADCISRKHARVKVENNALVVEDLRSTNNTFIDGKLIPPGQPVTAPTGSKIELAGKIKIIVG